ncbi:MAG: hypothetical protein MI867_14020, partial [Pseudomonadales bacterium]|nr:hypothetical protein [Pseudomonadales bacterium]
MIREYLRELLAFSRSSVVLNLALSIVAGLTQGISLVMLLPLLKTLGLNADGAISAGTGQSNGITGFISDAFSSIGLPLNLYTILAVYFAAVVVLSAINRKQTVLNSKLQQDFTLHLRIRLYESLTWARWLFTVQRKSADITHVMTSDLGNVGGT